MIGWCPAIVIATIYLTNSLAFACIVSTQFEWRNGTRAEAYVRFAKQRDQINWMNQIFNIIAQVYLRIVPSRDSSSFRQLCWLPS